MELIIKMTFLFMCGTIFGWCIELLWRRYFGLAKRWINPGFLNGPWLPLYGFGTIVLYFLSSLKITIVCLIPIFIVSLTALEFFTGLFFINFFKIRLWDYRQNKLNIMGLVCPFYTLLWTLIGVAFYYLIYPMLKENLISLLFRYDLVFFVGIFFGVFNVDVVVSFNLANRIKMSVIDSGQKWHVEYEKFKIELRDRFEQGIKNRTHFLLPFNGESDLLLNKRLNEHREKILKPIKRIKSKIRK
ncbi:putative ABC transporter permease [Sediminispirochaeta bajacaliforniensis]|uniref:putative ABC transporter permease n=1 Tax=Sediminispirochaeta bajacaliforniensis TaxID=148 RepID=UPI00036CFB28|nr:putative ABC transporter permease [Sediminispirochaeta bajacaliforniensis]